MWLRELGSSPFWLRDDQLYHFDNTFVNTGFLWLRPVFPASVTSSVRAEGICDKQIICYRVWHILYMLTPLLSVRHAPLWMTDSLTKHSEDANKQTKDQSEMKEITKILWNFGKTLPSQFNIMSHDIQGNLSYFTCAHWKHFQEFPNAPPLQLTTCKWEDNNNKSGAELVERDESWEAEHEVTCMLCTPQHNVGNMMLHIETDEVTLFWEWLSFNIRYFDWSLCSLFPFQVCINHINLLKPCTHICGYCISASRAHDTLFFLKLWPISHI